MVLPSILFDEIEQRNAAFVDASSVVELCSYMTFSILTTPFRDWRYNQELLEKVILKATGKGYCQSENKPLDQSFDSDDEYWLAQSVSLLERICAHDLLVVDGIALESLRGPEFNFDKLNAFSDLIYSTDVPPKVYSSIGTTLRDYETKMRELGVHSLMESEYYQFLGDDADKDYHEKLTVADIPTSLKTSGHSLTRTLFYLELGDEAGCPIFLSSKKRKWVKQLEKKLDNDAFKAIEAIFEKAIVEQATQQLESSFGLRAKVIPPPVLRLIKDVATQSGCSLLDACREIRESTGAKSFRRLVYQIQANLRQGGKGIIKAEKTLRQLEVEAASWYEKGIRVSTIDLSALPKIGWVFKLFGRVDLPLNNHILTGSRRYLTFISSWYDA